MKTVSLTTAVVPEKTLHCNIPHEGCGADVPENQYNKDAMLCTSCATRLADKYGLAYDCACYAILGINLPWYQQKFPGFGTIGEISQVRILAFAAGCQGVRNLTDRENRAAHKIRGAMPVLYVPPKHVDVVAEKIIYDIERDMKMAAAGGWE